MTVFEALEDAGLTAAAVNITCYRGRTEHRADRARPDPSGARAEPVLLLQPLRVGRDRRAARGAQPRRAGSIDAYAAAVGRWLVTRDGFDFLVYYLSDYDYASHALGPGRGARRARALRRRRRRADRGRRRADAFLERYAVVVCSDHGQTPVERVRPARRSASPATTASSRRRTAPGRSTGSRRRSARSSPRGSTATPAVEVALFREGARRSRGATARSSASARRGSSGDAAILDHPNGASAPGRRSRTRTRASCSSRPRRLGVRRPRRPAPRRRRQPRLARRGRLRGAGAHGRARRAAREHHRRRCPLALAHFGVAPPPYARALARARERRRRMVAAAAPPPGRRGRARARRDGARAARALRPGSARDRAYDDAALPIGHGQTISQPYMVARDLRGARRSRARARARRRHRLGLPGRGARRARGARSTRSSASRSSPSRRAAEARRGRLRERGGARRRRDARRPERAPFDAIAVAAAAPELPRGALRAAPPARPARRAGRRPRRASSSR